jgi:type I restriction enzyme S subunit
VRLIDVADVTIPGIFKRKFVTEPQFGYMYLTGGDVFQISPSSNRYLLKSVAAQYGLRVHRGSILIQEAGQVGGLVGRSVMVGSRIDGCAVSNNMVRVLPRDLGDAGYLYALLSTAEGVTLLAREAAGSSIPHIEVGRVRNIRIPWPDDVFRQEVGRKVVEAIGLRDEACADEDAARNIVESAVEGML